MKWQKTEKYDSINEDFLFLPHKGVGFLNYRIK